MVLSSSHRCEKAGYNTEGGLRSLPEGLRGFEIPYAKVLSVAVFLTILTLFLLSRRFIPEVRKPSFLRQEPATVDVPNKGAINPLEECNGGSVHSRLCTRLGGREAYIPGIRQGRVGRWVYQSGYTSLLPPLTPGLMPVLCSFLHLLGEKETLSSAGFPPLPPSQDPSGRHILPLGTPLGGTFSPLRTPLWEAHSPSGPPLGGTFSPSGPPLGVHSPPFRTPFLAQQ